MHTIDKALTVKDVASYLNVDEKTIYRLVSKGSIPSFKVSGSWRFQLPDIQGWIEKQKALNQAGRPQ